MGRSLLDRLRRAGLTVAQVGDCLVVEPKQRLTDELRAATKAAKVELLAALKAEDAAHCRALNDLEGRIRLMAKRWGYSSDELVDALAGARSDPQGWLLWTEQDEQDFGGCVTPEDFAARYARLRGLA